MRKKYELIDGQPRVTESGARLHQIRALRDIPSIGIKAGELGGWIEKEDNLSQKGNCWVFPHSFVYDNATVSGNACVGGGAQISGEARLTDDTRVWKARVYDRVTLKGFARVMENVHVYGDAIIETDVTETIHGYPDPDPT